MPFSEAIRLALQTIWSAKLRAFFTLLGIIVSVAFLVTVVAVIQGMNSYVRVNLTGAMIGSNAFQIRRTPIALGQRSDAEVREFAKRPLISQHDAEVIRRALPDAEAVAMQSGWPPPSVLIISGNQSIGGVSIIGITPGYQSVQDYRIAAGEVLNEVDLRARRPVIVIGWDVATTLYPSADAAIGERVRIAGRQYTIKGVFATKGKTLGTSFDAFALMPLPVFEATWGRRRTTVVSVKIREAAGIPDAMNRAEQAMRVAHQLGPTETNDFAVDKADALVAFWTTLTSVLFAIVPAVVCIGIVVGGIVIMNIMLMSVSERTREIGIRKALGARQRDIRLQFLVETVFLSVLGGIIGISAGWVFAELLAIFSPLPARVTWWSVGVSMLLGAGSGIVFGVYPATRAAKLDPITALRSE
ncbi:MAG: ABC transporter permease [Gemmatimonadales bacterium]